jgi:hypothetical protein
MSYWLIGLALWLAPAILLGLAFLIFVVRGSARPSEAGLPMLVEQENGDGPAEAAQGQRSEAPPPVAAPQGLVVGAESHSRSVA